MNKKAALHNLGCKVNAYELEAMQQMLEADGYEIVPFEPGADVYIVNTCTVTNIADRKSRQMLHKAKKMNPEAVVVAAGCYVQTGGEEIKKDTAIDLVIGNNKKQDLIQILSDYRQEKTSESVIDINHTQEYETLHISGTAEHTRAYMKIQDGCNQFCSYCIIPYARGRVRSRRPEDVLAEAAQLAKAGYREVVLTGIHLSSYGIDFDNEEKSEDYPYGQGLISLIESMENVDGISRVRLGSLEPGIMTEIFIQRLADCKKICPHFHLSMQSGCDATLKRMNRRYDSKAYAKGCLLLRESFKNPAITTDIIVGFPGETKEEFQQTKTFTDHIGFFETHIFKYSKRQGTKAAVMPNQVPEQIKAERSQILIDLGKKHQSQYAEQFIGKEVEVLFEEEIVAEDKTYWTGHTREYVRAILHSDESLENQVVCAQVSKVDAGGTLHLEQI